MLDEYIACSKPFLFLLELFDRVIFLGHGGRTVYSGSVEGAEIYFSKIGYPLPSSVNPADFYMDVISGSVSETNVYVNLFDEWEKHQRIVDEAAAEVRADADFDEKEEDKDAIEQRNSRSSLITGNTPLNEIMPSRESIDETSVTLTDVSGDNNSMYAVTKLLNTKSRRSTIDSSVLLQKAVA